MEKKKKKKKNVIWVLFVFRFIAMSFDLTFLCVAFFLHTHFARLLKNGSSHGPLVISYLVSSTSSISLGRSPKKGY